MKTIGYLLMLIALSVIFYTVCVKLNLEWAFWLYVIGLGIIICHKILTE